MYDSVKRILLQLLRVPHDPNAPAGSADSVRVFRASPRFYHWNLIQWGLLQVLVGFAASSFLVALTVVSAKFPQWLRPFAQIGVGLGLALFVVQLMITFWKQKLNYEMCWYIVTDRSLRIRSGVWSVQEITMTFANIQKVQLSQGPLQKILDIATVVVSSAGGGAASAEGGPHSGADRHAARFEGVGNAEEIRDFVLERLRRYRDAGLGDSAVVAVNEEDPALEAAGRVLEGARALRVALERR